MRFHSNIEKPRDGWMQIRFHGAGGEIDIFASYTPYDTFYELVTAMQAVLEYGNSHIVRINEEPRESSLIVEKSNEKLILSWPPEPGNSVSIQSNFMTGCREVARNIYHLYNDMGYDAFVQEWGHRPPKEKIEQLWAVFS